jgi:oligopeptide transport system substrate-binding protein
MKFLKTLLAAALSLGLLAGCGSSSDSSGKSVTVMADNDLLSMSSTIATDGTAFEVIQAYCDGLYGYNEDGSIGLALAEKETVSDDKLTYTYTLRDATWSNGEAVTANDFVYAWRQLIVQASEYAFLLGEQGLNVANGDKLYQQEDVTEADLETLGVKAVDEKTLEVTLATPCGFVGELLSFPVFFPINEAFAEEKGDQYALTVDNILSCGAFTVSSWETGSKVVLQKNENYWDADAVSIDTLTINLAQDASAAAVQFDNGEEDFCIINSSLVDKYADTEEYKTLDGGFLWYLFVNFENSDLANLNIRKGLSAAINRQDLVENILKDGSTAAVGYTPTGLATSPSGTDFAEDCGDLLAKYGISYDATKAQEYIDAGLKELGKTSINISMTYGTDESIDDVATYLEKAFSGLNGINFSLNATQKKARINDYQKSGNFDLSLTRWGPDFADPTTYLNNMEKSQWTNNNYGHYYNETYDKLMADSRLETDTTKRWENLVEANDILMQEVAIIPIFQKNVAVLQNTKLSGLISNSVGTPYIFKYLTLAD